MGNELYKLEEGSNAMTFEFTSVGPKVLLLSHLKKIWYGKYKKRLEKKSANH